MIKTADSEDERRGRRMIGRRKKKKKKGRKREREGERKRIGRNDEFAVGKTRNARRGVLIRVIECVRIKVSSASSVFFVTQRVNVEIARLSASRFAKLSTVSLLLFLSLAFSLSLCFSERRRSAEKISRNINLRSASRRPEAKRTC